MKKVLFLTNDINLSKGGQELANRYFLEMLKKKYNVYIINQQFFEETSNYKKVKVDINIDFRKGFIKHFFDLVKILKKINTQDFKVIFISAMPFSNLVYAFTIFLFNLFKDTKKILYSHIEPYYSLFYASRITYILLFLGKILYKRIDLILVSNGQMKESFIKYYKVKKEKIVVIPYPLRKEFNNLIKKDIDFDSLKIKPERPIFLSVGRLESKQKDPWTIIHAFSIFLKKNKKGLLIFAGDGEDKDKLIELTKKLKIDKKVFFLGFFKNPVSLMKKADVFVFSSKSEGMGIVLIEAQATGLPIIATDCPTGPRWVLANGKAGILVPVGDYLKMSEAMIKVIKDTKLKRRIIKEGFKLIHRFNYNSVEAKLLNII